MSRVEKVAEEIRREASLIVHEELRDPRLGFVTITHVTLTPDLRFARIFFSVYGDEQQWSETGKGLEHAAGFIRRLLGERLGLRFVPEITFCGDHSSEYSIMIEQEIEKIRQEKTQRQERKRGSRGPSKTARRTAKKKK